MKKRILTLFAIQCIIWFVFRTIETLYWLYRQPHYALYILEYKFSLFLIPGLLTSLIVVIIYLATRKHALNVISGSVILISNTIISFIVYFLIVSVHFKYIWIDVQHEISFTHFFFSGYNYWLFLFTLNASCFLYDYWVEFKNQKLRLQDAVLRQKEQYIIQPDLRLYLPDKRNGSFIKISEIKYIQADTYISKIVIDDNKTISLNQTLKRWEEKLPDKQFLRIHKSYIVNLNFIDKVIKKPNQTYEVYISGDGSCLPMSRRAGKEFNLKHNYKSLNDRK